MPWLLAQTGDPISDAALTKGAERMFDLGLSGVLLALVGLVLVKWIIPRYMTQHESLLAEMLTTLRADAAKARADNEAILAMHERNFQYERDHHKDTIQLLIAEWRQTREQLHDDAARLHDALRTLGDSK